MGDFLVDAKVWESHGGDNLSHDHSHIYYRWCRSGSEPMAIPTVSLQWCLHVPGRSYWWFLEIYISWWLLVILHLLDILMDALYINSLVALISGSIIWTILRRWITVILWGLIEQRLLCVPRNLENSAMKNKSDISMPFLSDTLSRNDVVKFI